MGTNSRDLDELRRDFEAALSRIDFSLYNPLSAEFNTALNLGVMLKLLDCADMAAVAEHAEEVERESEISAADDIDQLLILAKKYASKYDTTSDTTYKTVAFDLTKDAKFLIRRALTVAAAQKERSILKEYEGRADEISKLI